MRTASFIRDVIRQRVGLRIRPRFLTYIVTFTCNARCIMCDSWKKPSPNDLTLDEIEAIFRQLPRLDAVRLSGGEPFVRTDLDRVAALVHTHLRPEFLHVTSNGFLTDRIVAFCEQRPRDLPLRLLISLDGLSEKHNAIRGRATAFDSATATLKALAPRRDELRLHLSVNQTIVDTDGLAEYRRLRDFLAPLGIRNQAVMAYDASATYSLQSEVDLAPKHAGGFPTFGAIDSPALAAFLDEAEEDATSLPLAERAARRYYLRGLRSRLHHGSPAPTPSPNPPCVALNAHLRILPNGDVPTCQFNSRTLGNLRHQPFDEVWYGALAQQQRSWVRQCPGCWAECEILPSAIYTADLLRAFVPSFRTPGAKLGCPHPLPTAPTASTAIQPSRSSP